MLQLVKAKDCILKFIMFVNLRPTGALQTTVALSLPEEDSPLMVKLDTLATMIFASRTWSPDKNTIVVLEVKYSSALRAYSESPLYHAWVSDHVFMALVDTLLIQIQNEGSDSTSRDL